MQRVSGLKRSALYIMGLIIVLSILATSVSYKSVDDKFEKR